MPHVGHEQESLVYILAEHLQTEIRIEAGRRTRLEVRDRFSRVKPMYAECVGGKIQRCVTKLSDYHQLGTNKSHDME